MLDPDVGDRRVVQRAADTVVLETVDAVGNLALDGKVRQIHVGTGAAVIGVVSIHAHAGAVAHAIAVAAARRGTGQNRIPRPRARQGDVVDQDVAGDQIRALRNPDGLPLSLAIVDGILDRLRGIRCTGRICIVRRSGD